MGYQAESQAIPLPEERAPERELSRREILGLMGLTALVGLGSSKAGKVIKDCRDAIEQHFPPEANVQALEMLLRNSAPAGTEIEVRQNHESPGSIVVIIVTETGEQKTYEVTGLDDASSELLSSIAGKYGRQHHDVKAFIDGPPQGKMITTQQLAAYNAIESERLMHDGMDIVRNSIGNVEYKDVNDEPISMKDIPLNRTNEIMEVFINRDFGSLTETVVEGKVGLRDLADFRPGHLNNNSQPVIIVTNNGNVGSIRQNLQANGDPSVIVVKMPPPGVDHGERVARK